MMEQRIAEHERTLTIACKVTSLSYGGNGDQ
jgi:hypothetical protein